MERQVADLLAFLEAQDDIIGVDINSDIERDYGSFSLSGLKVESRGYIYPAALGFDLGCGVGVFRMQNCNAKKLKELQFSPKSIFGIRRKKTYIEICEEENYLAELQDAMNKTYYGEIEKGNHFLEIQKNGKNEFFLVVHSGIPMRLKEQFESFFINFYHKYVKEDTYGDNGYVVKVPSQSEDGRVFLRYVLKQMNGQK